MRYSARFYFSYQDSSGIILRRHHSTVFFDFHKIICKLPYHIIGKYSCGIDMLKDLCDRQFQGIFNTILVSIFTFF